MCDVVTASTTGSFRDENQNRWRSETVVVRVIVWWRYKSTHWLFQDMPISKGGRQRLLSRSLCDDVTSSHTGCFGTSRSAQMDIRDFSCHGHCVMTLQFHPLVLSGMKISTIGHQRLLPSRALCDDVTTPHTLVVSGHDDHHRWTLKTLAVKVIVWWRYNSTRWLFQGMMITTDGHDIRKIVQIQLIHWVMMLQLHTLVVSDHGYHHIWTSKTVAVGSIVWCPYNSTHWLFQTMTIATTGHQRL